MIETPVEYRVRPGIALDHEAIGLLGARCAYVLFGLVPAECSAASESALRGHCRCGTRHTGYLRLIPAYGDGTNILT